jgi:hypothetical protein
VFRYLCSIKLQTSTVSQNHFHARQAAAALLKMAKTTTDREVAANLVRVAADLKDQVGELPPEISCEPPDVQMGKSKCYPRPSPKNIATKRR